eukprot:UN26325
MDELMKATQSLRLNLSHNDLKRTFQRFDTDRSGFITEKEFMIAVVGQTYNEIGVSKFVNELTDWVRRTATELQDLRSKLNVVNNEKKYLLKNKKDLLDVGEEQNQSHLELIKQLEVIEKELAKTRKELKAAKEQNAQRINRLELDLKTEKENNLECLEKIRELDKENEMLTKEIGGLNLFYEP